MYLISVQASYILIASFFFNRKLMHPPLKTFMDWHQIFRNLLRRAIFFFISQEIVFEEEIVKMYFW